MVAKYYMNKKIITGIRSHGNSWTLDVDEKRQQLAREKKRNSKVLQVPKY